MRMGVGAPISLYSYQFCAQIYCAIPERSEGSGGALAKRSVILSLEITSAKIRGFCGKQHIRACAHTSCRCHCHCRKKTLTRSLSHTTAYCQLATAYFSR